MNKKYCVFLFSLIFLAFSFKGNAGPKPMIHIGYNMDTVNAQPLIRIDSIPNELVLSGLWRYHEGDNIQWASPAVDDDKWSTLHSYLNESELKQFKGIGWFRIHLKVSSALFHKTFAIKMSEDGASEVYLNGKLVHSFGTVSATGNESPFDPTHGSYFIQLSGDTSQVIAVRYTAWKALARGLDQPGFTISIQNVSMVNGKEKEELGTVAGSVFLSSVFFAFAMFHLLLFVFYRKVRSNFYYSVMAFILAVFWLYPCIMLFTPNAIFHSYVNMFMFYIYPPFFFMMVLLLYSIFGLRFGVVFWVIIGLTVLSMVLANIDTGIYGIALAVLVLVSSIESLRIAIGAVRRKKPGAWIIATGFSVFSVVILIVLVIVLVAIFGSNRGEFDSSSNLLFSVFIAWAFSIPTSMSVYLASDFARTNKTLALQLVHVKQLGEQNLEKEREKQQLIAEQNEMLERQVKEKTHEIQEQKDELEEKNKEITDSITYARRIQNAILPTPEMMAESLGEYLVVYKPKDVVSGDFYWCHSSGDKVIFAVADCTGHGVPGAFMSMIGNSILNEVVIDRKITDADAILNELRSTLIYTLQKSTGQTTRDGMDIALCVLNKKDNTLQYAGANNSLYWISENIAVDGGVNESEKIRLGFINLLEVVADKQPVGYQEGKMDNPFTKHTIQLRKGDLIYITSDGYTDQFGGERNKKFTSKRFREMLASFVNQPITVQKQILEDTIELWKKYETQTDDICVIGIKI